MAPVERLKRFKADTMGKPVVMGRKTWESFPRRPLPGRPNIVVSRDKAYRAEGAEVVTSLGDALTLAEARGRCMASADEICVIGGGEIYRQAIGIADRLHVTHVLASVAGDTRFPADRPGDMEAGRRRGFSGRRKGQPPDTLRGLRKARDRPADA